MTFQRSHTSSFKSAFNVAETALGVGRGQLVDSSRCVVDACMPSKRASLQNAGRVQTQATDCTFAAIPGDGSIVTRGHAAFRGAGRGVYDQLEKFRV